MKIELTKSPKTLVAIAHLFQRELAHKDLYGTVYTSPKLGKFLNKLNQGGSDEFLTVTDSGLLVGAIQFRFLPGTLHVNNIAVSSCYHGRGAGVQLMEWLIRRASNLGVIVTLDVSLSNTKAVSWYKKMGFLENAATSNFIYLCDGTKPMNEMVVFDSLSNLNDYGFSEARHSNERTSRFFCIQEHFIRLKSGFVMTADEIAWFKKNFNGFLIINSESIDKSYSLRPFFIQTKAKMELKCG